MRRSPLWAKATFAASFQNVAIGKRSDVDELERLTIERPGERRERRARHRQTRVA